MIVILDSPTPLTLICRFRQPPMLPLLRRLLLPALVHTIPLTLAAQVPVAQRLDTAHVNVASRVDTSAKALRSMTVMDRREIDGRAARSVADVVGWGLGVDLMPRSAAQADLAIRGSSFEQVVVLVDGVRVSDDQTGHFDLDLAVPLALVERVEVLRGSGSAIYGPDAVGGVVNIVTRGGATARAGLAGTTSGRGGSFGTAGLAGTLTRGSPGSGLTLGVEHERSDGHRADTDYRVTQARASAARAVGTGTLSLDLGVGVRDFGAADFYAPQPSHERTRSGTAALRWKAPLADGWSLSATTSGRRHDDRFTLRRDDPGFYQNEHTLLQAGTELVARGPAAGGVTLAVGGEGSGSWLRSQRLGDREAGRGALFAEASKGVSRATVNAGLRADWSSRDGTVVSPSLAAGVGVGERLRLRGSVSRGFRAPTWTERYYEDPVSIGDPELLPETFWVGELGARLEFGAGVYLDMAGWARRAHDLIDWARPVGAPGDEPWRTRNVAAATFRGIEGELRLPEWRGASWSVRAATTSVDAAAATGWTGRYALRPLTRSVSAHARVPFGGGFLLAVDAGVAGHAGERRYGRADARLSYNFQDARFNLDLVNLGDASYLDASARPVAGRALYAGMEWRW